MIWKKKKNTSMTHVCLLSVSAFYAEHFKNRISIDGYVWTKSKFLGLSVGVYMVGQSVLSVADYGEEYIMTFPNAYGRYVHAEGSFNLPSLLILHSV